MGLGVVLCVGGIAVARAQVVLTVAAYPAVDEIVRSAVPAWKRLHPIGVSEAELPQSWDGYVAAGVKLKEATGAYLMAHAHDMKDILIRTGIRPGEGLYFDSQCNVLVSSPRFVRTFELARNTEGLWRAAQLPEDAFAAYGETFHAIPRGSPTERKRLAWQFIQLMTLDRDVQLAAFMSKDAFADEVINTELDKVLERGKDIGLALADAEGPLKQRARR